MRVIESDKPVMFIYYLKSFKEDGYHLKASAIWAYNLTLPLYVEDCRLQVI